MQWVTPNNVRKEPPIIRPNEAALKNKPPITNTYNEQNPNKEALKFITEE